MEKSHNRTWVIILVVCLSLLWYKYDNLKEENSYLRRKLYDYKSALEEANDNIEQVNSYIEEAQGYAWESYEEMGEALDNLQTVDTVRS